ncbi:Endopeptidase degP [Granulibacter bethesdensis]|uniref:Endopeptidase degP n=2 Tax=Granulibacter bethesdensis TaxID=364410 RepID=A0AAN0VER8_9PROT|nr:Endopeptidase degP [Granulibacter bethesdensis]AHJ64518.1 Endopeptidase degP [Granulibacter bethesdensis CGDNIH4]
MPFSKPDRSRLSHSRLNGRSNRRRAFCTVMLAAMLLSTSACQARTAPDSFAPLVKKIMPAVVNIAVTESLSPQEALAQMPPELKGTPFEKQFRDKLRGRREQVMGAGSGFILDPSGIIITNNHVVGHADRIIVSLSDGSELPARVLGIDDLTDIAVIKVNTSRPLPYVTWGDSHVVEVGDWILAAGNPFGLGGSVTAGIVSARGRDIGAGPFDDFLQLDAPINPGNSGGPTFNMAGQVVGLNTAIVSPTGGSVGIGFAIPAELAAHVVEILRSKGHIDRGWLGVAVEDSSQTDMAGVLIASVDKNGPAARSGLRAGDLVEAVNGAAVQSARSLIRAIAAIPPGSTARLTVQRQGRDVDIEITVGRRPAEHAG